MKEQEESGKKVHLTLVPLAVAAATLIAAGWVGFLVLRKTRFRRAARVARKVEVVGQRMFNLAENPDVRPVFSEDETAA